MKRFSIIALTLLLGVACNNDDIVESKENVSFSSAPLTRASDTEWAIDDRVGIYVGESTSAYQYVVQSTDGSVIEPASNSVQKSTDDEGEIAYYAYYPYRSSLTSTTYSVDVSEQSDLSSIDLLWAKSVDSDLDVVFGFEHQLVKLVIDVTIESGSLSDIGATMYDAYKSASFDLNSGEFSSQTTGSIILAVSETDSQNATITAIVPPMSDLSDVYINFNIGSSYEKCEFSQFDTTEWESGKVYEYGITLSDNE